MISQEKNPIYVADIVESVGTGLHKLRIVDMPFLFVYLCLTLGIGRLSSHFKKKKEHRDICSL